jgi:predicted MPP superfamily phosphohydrolase
MRSAVVANLAGIAYWSLVGVATFGTACIAYGIVIERRWFRRVTYTVAALPSGAPSRLSILHLSDLHMVNGDRRMAAFLASLPAPDVCVVTGDVLGEPEAVESCVQALRPLRGRVASLFVLGSNDYYAPRPLNYLAYFGRRRRRRAGSRSRGAELRAALEADGWQYAANRRASFSRDGLRCEVIGLDDPHIERHDLRVALRRDPQAFGLAVVHSPDPAPELAALGFDLILSGHTHGGQVRMPVVGALVTNSTIPTRLCMGLSRFGHAFLHVSPGLGTSKYAPFRFLCRPEATVLDLVARPGPAQPPDSTRSKARS